MFSKFKLHEQGASKQEAEEDDDDEYNGMNIIYKLYIYISADPTDGKGEHVREDITISQGQEMMRAS